MVALLQLIAIMYEREGEVHMADGSGGRYALAPIKYHFLAFRVVKREFSLIAKGTPGWREVDARLHCIVVGGVADGFAAAVLLTLAVVVTGCVGRMPCSSSFCWH